METSTTITKRPAFSADLDMSVLREWRPPLWLVGLLVAIASWGIEFGQPASGLDNSWVAGLYMAAHSHVDFGTQVIFTFGPLGFLSETMLFYGGLGVLSFIYCTLLFIGVATSLVWALRRTLGMPAAAFGAFLILSVLPGIDQPITLAVIWSLVALQSDPPERAKVALAVGGASFAALEILIKLSNGPIVVAVCLIALVGARAELRLIGIFLGLFIAETVALWLIAGQSLGALPDYISNSREIISGYSEAMALEQGAGWQIPLAVFALVMLAAGAAFATYKDNLARWCGVGIVTLAAFALFKEGAIRQEPEHIVIYFSTAALLWAILPWSIARRGALAAGVIVLAAFGLHVQQIGLSPRLDVIANADLARQQIGTLVNPGKQDELTDNGRALIRGSLKIDDSLLTEMDGHTVAVDPWEISAAWAYGLDWQPLPVFQNYAAFTEKLDQLNAGSAASPDGPDRILRENAGLVDAQWPDRAIDGRYPGWEPPAQSIAVLCNFAPLRTTARWQVLGRIPDRCGEPESIKTVDSSYGTPVVIPEAGPGEVVFVKIHGAEVSGLEKLRTLLLRSKLRLAKLDGGNDYRLVPGTAGDGLLLRSDPAVERPGPYSQIPQAKSIELTGVSGDLEFEFFRMPIQLPMGSDGEPARKAVALQLPAG